MSTPTSLIAWAGVYAYIAIYYGALYALRRQREYVAFACMMGALSLLSAATAWTASVSTVAEVILPQQLQYVASLATVVFFVDVVLALTDDAPSRRLLRASYAWAGLGAAAIAAGLFFDPAFAHPTYDFSLPRPGHPAIASTSIVGVVFIAGANVLGGYAVVRLFAAARRRRELRATAVITCFGLIGSGIDVACLAFHMSNMNVGVHASLLPALGFSYLLVSRFTRIDAELADRKEALARSYDHLRLAQEELVRKEQLATVGELSAVIAHEVRNPLAIIKNAVGGLRRTEIAPADADTLLGILDEETDRLNRLVNDLLAYAKPIAPEPGHVDLRKLVMHAVELAAGGNQDISKIEIELDLEAPVDEVEADEALLRHALINIVDNALQAMPLGGTLTVACHDTDIEGRPAVAVEVHDTGEGMDTLVRTKARDPFFTTRQSGTGLGLAIVDRVARVHGGRVELDSRHGHGTTVRFIVPRERSSVAPSS